MWSEWLARTLKPRPAPRAQRRTAAAAEERLFAGEAAGAALPEECAAPLHGAALECAAVVTREAL